ncbi:MAG: hypothetical protein GEV11_15690 [Streptosporangiales bacterium]|nr:hypothetical protein [Streptosporangiales bacterium]
MPHNANRDAHHTALNRWTSATVRAARSALPPGADIPAYGSPQWLALPFGPVKLAALVIAAETWRRETDPVQIAARLRDELAATQWAQDQRDAEDWAAIQQSVRALRRLPTPAQVAERRQAATRPDGRPADHPGGPVDYWTGRPLTNHDTESEAA